MPGLSRQSRRPLQRRRLWMPGSGPRRTRREIVWRHRCTRPEPLLAFVPIPWYHARSGIRRPPGAFSHSPEGSHPKSSDRPVVTTVSARAAASRRNGARSRGPGTAAGKAGSAFSSRDALQHGLQARVPVLPRRRGCRGLFRSVAALERYAPRPGTARVPRRRSAKPTGAKTKRIR